MASTNEKQIWDYLNKELGNSYGAAGLIGNLYAESGLNPNNLQNSFEKKLGFNDTEYTEAVDSGTYGNFANDGAGYGLAQWSYKTRKLKLLSLAKSKKRSVGDLETQLQFLIEELQNYPTVLNTLQTAKSVKEASDIVLSDFEQAKPTEATRTKRASYGQEFYDKYAKGEIKIMADYSKYINSTGTHYISNSGSDEKGGITGGQAGDQTGKEWQLKAWYNRPWTHVFRYEKNPKVGETLANLGCAAALNDKIGYDQSQRGTYWTQLQKANYDPSKITTACEADCSAGAAANVKATGYILGIPALQNVSSGSSSRNTLAQLKAAGFTVLTDTKYLTSGNYLLPGDILLYENHHVATNVTKGKKATSIPSGSTTSPAPSTSTNNGTPIGQAEALGAMYIRSSAGSTGKALGTVTKGTKLEVLEVLSNGWYKVIYQGSIGYTSNSTGKYYKYTEYEKTVTPSTVTTPEVPDGNVIGIATALGSMHIRVAPNSGAKSLGTIPKGTKVEVLEVADGWYKIKTTKTNEGYAFTSNTSGKYYNFEKVANSSTNKYAPEGKKDEYAGQYEITASSLNVRQGAGTDKNIVIALPKGTKVTCDGSYSTYNNTTWLYVSTTYKYVTIAGYVFPDYLKRV